MLRLRPPQRNPRAFSVFAGWAAWSTGLPGPPRWPCDWCPDARVGEDQPRGSVPYPAPSLW